jgi:hypothetical protein
MIMDDGQRSSVEHSLFEKTGQRSSVSVYRREYPNAIAPSFEPQISIEFIIYLLTLAEKRKL